MSAVIGAALLLAGCGERVYEPVDFVVDTGWTPPVVTPAETVVPADADGDGFSELLDCDDSDPDVFPGQVETPYDGIDNDCISLTPDDDLDGDGYGIAEDCNDTSADAFPGGVEVRSDGVDNDCDPSTCFGGGFSDVPVQFALPDYELGTFFRSAYSEVTCESTKPTWSVIDIDGDGLGDMVQTFHGCEHPDGVGETAWRVHRNLGTGFDTNSSLWALPEGYGAGTFYVSAGAEADCDDAQVAWELVDIDGDDLLDVVITSTGCGAATIGLDEWWVHRNTGSGFDAIGASWHVPTGYATGTFDALSETDGDCGHPAWTLFDIDADGLSDVVLTSEDCGAETGLGVDAWHVHRNTGTGFDDGVITFGLPPDYPLGTFDRTFEAEGDCDLGRPSWQLLDLDLDGLSDVVLTTDGCGDSVDLGVTHWWVHRNTGTGFDASTSLWALPEGYSPATFDTVGEDDPNCVGPRPTWTLLDIDGEGRPDVVATSEGCPNEDVYGVEAWMVYPNTGTRFEASPVEWSVPQQDFGPGTFELHHQGDGDCDDGIPAWTLWDIDGDDLTDVVVTSLECSDEEVVGISQWTVYPGLCDQ